VRITAQLLSAADGFHLWSQTYDRELTGVFAVQDDISKAVVDALKLQLVSRKEPARRHEPSPEAHNEYWLGHQFMYRLTYDNYLRAAAAYERATKFDPEYAQAWAGLASATLWVADDADTVAAISEGFDRALAHAEKAVALDPELADGYAARGNIRGATRWDWEGARADFARALALNPGDATMHVRYASTVLSALGRLPEAIEEARKATEIDPLSAVAWSAFGRMLYSGGQLDPARAALEKSLHIAPEQIFAAHNLSVVLLLQKRPAEALEQAERSTSEVFKRHGKAMALYDLGRTQEAHQTLDELIARFGHSGAYQIAETYAWFGQPDKAFEWLDRAYAQRDGGLTAIKFDMLLRSLRNDPRYTAMLRKMNLPPD
jgi:tetratricopeptide (TPR) repeat protein